MYPEISKFHEEDADLNFMKRELTRINAFILIHINVTLQNR